MKKWYHGIIPSYITPGNLLKVILEGSIYICLVLIIYFSIVERFWHYPNSMMALLFAISYNILVYNTLRFIKINTLKNVLRFLYLLSFSVLLVISYIGKINWLEIPKMSMIYDVFFKNTAMVSSFWKPKQ